MTEYTFDDLAAVMGTYNEATVGTVLRDTAEVTDGRAEVVCVGSSDDRTPEIAREHGARLSHGAAAMPAFNQFGNAAFAAVASVLAGERVHDTTTRMCAYRLLHDTGWTENTGLSAELLLRPLRGYQVREEPTTYRGRAGETKLDPLGGGAAIAKSIVKVCLEERFG